MVPDFFAFVGSALLSGRRLCLQCRPFWRATCDALFKGLTRFRQEGVAELFGRRRASATLLQRKGVRQ